MPDIGAKVKIDGEKQFRDELKQMTQQGKTLSAQMKLLSSSFADADNKEEELSKATKNLDSQIQNQQRIVDKLREAVTKSASAKGEDATETLKLKEQLAKAETALNKLNSTTAETALGVGELAEEEKDAGNQADKASGKMSAWTVALGNLISDAVKAGFNFLVDSLKSIVNYFVDATKGAAEFADEIKTLSSTTSLSTDTLQEYQYMASLVDVDLSTISGSLTKLTKNMASAKDGNKAAAEAFAKLGVSVTDSEGNLRSSNDVFNDVIDALGQIDNEAERDAAAMDIFGKSAKDLNPLIEAGSDALNGLRQEAHDVGYVLDNETLDSLGDVQDGFNRLGLAGESLKNKVGASIGTYILPYLNELVSAVQELVGGGDFDTFASRMTAMFDSLLSDLTNVLPSILSFGSKLLQSLIMGINKALPKLAPMAITLISDFARFLLNNLPTIVETAVTIILALVNGLAEQAPTLIPAAIDCVLQIVQGLLSHVGDIIAAALSLVDGIVEGLTGEEGITKIIDAIPTLIMSLVEGILNNLDKIIAAGINITVNLTVGLIKAIPQLIAKLPEMFIAVTEALEDFDWASLGENIMANLSDGVKDTVSTVWNAVKDAFSKAVEWIKNLGSEALKWGKDMIDGFIKGIGEKAKALWDKVEGIADKIKGFLHFSRPDFGPLRDYETWMPDFMKGLAHGIDANAWRVQDALKNATGGMSVAGGSTSVTNLGGVAVNVYAQPNQDANAIAQQVIAVMTNELNAKRAVFA